MKCRKYSRKCNKLVATSKEAAKHGVCEKCYLMFLAPKKPHVVKK